MLNGGNSRMESLCEIGRPKSNLQKNLEIMNVFYLKIKDKPLSPLKKNKLMRALLSEALNENPCKEKSSKCG